MCAHVKITLPGAPLKVVYKTHTLECGQAISKAHATQNASVHFVMHNQNLMTALINYEINTTLLYIIMEPLDLNKGHFETSDFCP